MNFRVLPEADRETVCTALWYEDQRHGLGGEFLDALEAGLNAVRSNPHSLPKLEGYSGPHETRQQTPLYLFSTS